MVIILLILMCNDYCNNDNINNDINIINNVKY